MKAVLVPVKNLDGVKQRLASVLDPGERRRLVRTMLADVASALAPLTPVAPVILVSGDPWARQFARRQGWEILVESAQASKSDSVDWASGILQGRGFTAVLRLPGDIPLIRADDVRLLIEPRSEASGAVIVPSADGTGTNALLRSPPGLFPSRFGPGSFRLHRAEAKQRGVTCKVVHNSRIALDLDTPADLIEFVRQGTETRTWRWLDDSGILARLPTAVEPRVAERE